jgi:hypothetical protein
MGISVLWRVELQRRKAAHIHAVMWVPAGFWSLQKVIRDAWCTAVGSPDDFELWLHGTFTAPIRDSNWLLYVSMHNSKSKKEQLGWIGKQWGVIGRKRFARREALEVRLSIRGRWMLQRAVRRLLVNRGANDRALPAYGGWLRCVRQEDARRLVAWASCFE